MAPTSTGNGWEARQRRTPILSALVDYRARRVVPFDVPGHKQGRGNPVLRDFLGEACLSVDVNSMKPLDNLCHPTSVIREAEELFAEAFGCDRAFFMVGGTTSSVQAMILSACGEGDPIILPRNVHRSVLNALILTGAAPVYVNPGIDARLGIPLGMPVADVVRAIGENPDAKAVFVNNPTYYGICSDLDSIIRAAHRAGMLVLADEAHGTHFYFHEELPPAAMRLGADMAAVSVHKTGGSLTQSSALLLSGRRLDPDRVRTVINLTQTTSASYLLLSSLDIARRNLAQSGREIFGRVLELSGYARREINLLGGYDAFSDELVNGDTVAGFDRTRLSVHTLAVGLAGVEVYDILRDGYGIQIELGDVANILAILSVGDTRLAVERLVAALSEIKRLHGRDRAGMFDHEYIRPDVRVSPKRAFYAPRRRMPLKDSAGRVSAEFVSSYPPGIPILAPGEAITGEILDYIRYARDKGSLLTGPEDMTLSTIGVLENTE